MAADTKQAARSLPGRIGDAIHCVVALGTRLVRANLADPLQHLNGHALLARPARKPRTVCGAQPMASAMAGPLAPPRDEAWRGPALLGVLRLARTLAGGCHSACGQGSAKGSKPTIECANVVVLAVGGGRVPPSGVGAVGK